MPSQHLSAILPHLCRLLADVADEPDDSQLLARFIRGGDDVAFAVMVRRHGPMVLAVCRRLLADPHDAEDAFQATFLVLVRKASSVRRPERLSNWLYGVAHRVALKMRGHNARRRRLQRPLVDVPVDGALAELDWRELRPTLDEELSRLPEKYRVPVVLCYLEGVSKREAARQLSWPEGTLSTRLHRARSLLRGRLARRGLGLSAGGIAVALAHGAAPAAVPAALVIALGSLARRSAPVPASITALAEGVVRTMWWSKLKVVVVVLLVAGALAAGLGGAARHTPAAPPEGEARVPLAGPAAEAPKKESAEPRTFHLGKDVKEVVWSPDGKRMASRAARTQQRNGGDTDALDWYSTVTVWDAATGKEITSLGELKNSGLVGMGFSPDGTTLALSFFRQIQEGARVELWDARRGSLEKTIEMDYGRIVPKFAFAPDGKVLAVLYAGDQDRDGTTGDLNGGVRLFDLASGKVIRSLRGHKHMAISLAVSPDGRRLATGGSQHDNDIRVWDLATGKLVSVFQTGAIVPAVAFSPDGKLLASGQGDGRLVLRDAATGREIRVLEGAPGSSLAVAFSPDGRLLAAAGTVEQSGRRSYTVRLWNAASGAVLRSWEDTGASFAFTPDARALAILGKDGSVRLWELKRPEAPAAPQAGYGFSKLIDQLIQEKKTDDEATEWLFVAALGRFPDQRERQFVADHLARKKDRREAMLDAVWALINTKEFQGHLDVLNGNDPRRLLRKE